ncbi:MAG: protein TolQ [Persicimonas sp.]
MWDAIWVNLVTANADAESNGIVQIVADADGVVLAVLVLLAALSIASWYIIGYKWFFLRKVRRESIEFLDDFWQSKRLDAIYQSADQYPEAPVSEVFKAGYVELSKLKDRDKPEGEGAVHLEGIENVERSLRRAASSERTRLESMVPFLATVGSTSPFIGLFGTVWGIMVAFMDISAQNETGIDVVAQPIAEALIVTAAGLFAAIPAVIFYNHFVNKIKVIGAEMDNFSSDFLNIVKRHFFN